MPLAGYFDILRRDTPPKFTVAASISSRIKSGEVDALDLEVLRRSHEDLMREFRLISNRRDMPVPPEEISLLDLKGIIAKRMLGSCEICENRCRADRLNDERGDCGVGNESYYASEFLHYGEEEELVPSHTVFFTGCTFKCVYCQNYDISSLRTAKLDAGLKADRHLVVKILDRERNARNLNLVGGNPDQHIANIISLLLDLAESGYSNPIVWNSNLYCTPETTDLLNGIVDVHLADFKYGSNKCGKHLSRIDGYWDIITRNLSLVRDEADILIRHLVLPGHVECCTANVCEWIGKNLPDARFNLMFQYHPEHEADRYPEINRALTYSEMDRAKVIASHAGLI